MATHFHSKQPSRGSGRSTSGIHRLLYSELQVCALWCFVTELYGSASMLDLHMLLSLLMLQCKCQVRMTTPGTAVITFTCLELHRAVLCPLAFVLRHTAPAGHHCMLLEVKCYKSDCGWDCAGDCTQQLLWRLQHGEAPAGVGARHAVLNIGTNEITEALASVRAPTCSFLIDFSPKF